MRTLILIILVGSVFCVEKTIVEYRVGTNKIVVDGTEGYVIESRKFVVSHIDVYKMFNLIAKSTDEIEEHKCGDILRISNNDEKKLIGVLSSHKPGMIDIRINGKIYSVDRVAVLGELNKLKLGLDYAKIFPMSSLDDSGH
jgi:hypothetical protein